MINEDQGRELANELGIRFMETSAKVNEGVEEAFFTLARYGSLQPPKIRLTSQKLLFFFFFACSDIKTRLIDSQPDASASANTTSPGSSEKGLNVSSSYPQQASGCCQ